VVDPPELLVSRVQRQRADPGIRMVGECIRHSVTPRLVFESEDEFTHTRAYRAYDFNTLARAIRYSVSDYIIGVVDILHSSGFDSVLLL